MRADLPVIISQCLLIVILDKEQFLTVEWISHRNLNHRGKKKALPYDSAKYTAVASFIRQTTSHLGSSASNNCEMCQPR